MIKEKIDDRVYFKSEALESEKAVHFFTSKIGGFSKGIIDGLNLGFRVGDQEESVVENYRQISCDFGIPFENIVAAKQIHSADIRIVTNAEAGFGVSKPQGLFEADGLVTNCRNIPIMVFYADCVPILLMDEDKGVVAAVHSGWRGTVSEIVGKCVDIMVQQFGAREENIKAAIGPSIGKCCFETGSEVAEFFDASLKTPGDEGKFFVDLWSANKEILKRKGLKPSNIEVLKLCTVCNKDLLYSYRAHKEKTGRMGAVIMLK